MRTVRRSIAPLFALVLAWSAPAGIAASGCQEALERHAVCEAANRLAKDAMRRDHLQAVIVMQDVSSGAVVAFAASDPDRLDVSTQVLPLSLAKVFLAASGGITISRTYCKSSPGKR